MEIRSVWRWYSNRGSVFDFIFSEIALEGKTKKKQIPFNGQVICRKKSMGVSTFRGEKNENYLFDGSSVLNCQSLLVLHRTADFFVGYLLIFGISFVKRRKALGFRRLWGKHVKLFNCSRHLNDNTKTTGVGGRGLYKDLTMSFRFWMKWKTYYSCDRLKFILIRFFFSVNWNWRQKSVLIITCLHTHFLETNVPVQHILGQAKSLREKWKTTNFRRTNNNR